MLVCVHDLHECVDDFVHESIVMAFKEIFTRNLVGLCISLSNVVGLFISISLIMKENCNLMNLCFAN